MPAMPERISRFINNLEESGTDSESKLKKIIENEYRRRLNRYYLIDTFHSLKNNAICLILFSCKSTSYNISHIFLPLCLKFA